MEGTIHVRETLYIDGDCVASAATAATAVINATTEEVMGRVPKGTAGDVDRAAQAARAAFPAWSQTSVTERAGYLQRIADGLQARSEEIATVISQELGMPIRLSQLIQVGQPTRTFGAMPEILAEFPFEERIGNSLVVREPVGVVGCISPWNYPLHQIAAKAAPALAAACTVIAKPSEAAPINAFLLADGIDDAGLPAGAFNLGTRFGTA